MAAFAHLSNRNIAPGQAPQHTSPMEHQSLSCKFAGAGQGLGRAPSPSMREVLLMTENSAVQA